MESQSSTTKILTEQWVAIGAAAVVFIGALLPWASVRTGFGTVSRAGIDDGGDGLFTLILGVVGAAGAWRPSRAGVWMSVGCGLLVAGIGLWDAFDISSSDIEVGGGLYLTILGGVAMFAAGLKIWEKRRRPPHSEVSG